MLLEEFDLTHDAVINPEMVVHKIEDFPEVTISCFSRHLFERVLALFDTEKIGDLHSAVGLNPVYKVEYQGRQFALFQSYVGEPLCVAEYEDLMAMGVRRWHLYRMDPSPKCADIYESIRVDHQEIAVCHRKLLEKYGSKLDITAAADVRTGSR